MGVGGLCPWWKAGGAVGKPRGFQGVLIPTEGHKCAKVHAIILLMGRFEGGFGLLADIIAQYKPSLSFGFFLKLYAVSLVASNAYAIYLFTGVERNWFP